MLDKKEAFNTKRYHSARCVQHLEFWFYPDIFIQLLELWIFRKSSPCVVKQAFINLGRIQETVRTALRQHVCWFQQLIQDFNELCIHIQCHEYHRILIHTAYNIIFKRLFLLCFITSATQDEWSCYSFHHYLHINMLKTTADREKYFLAIFVT